MMVPSEVSEVISCQRDQKDLKNGDIDSVYSFRVFCCFSKCDSSLKRAEA